MGVLHFFNVSSICHVVQWEFQIVFIFHQFSMLFNGKFAFYPFPMLFNGNLKLEKLRGGGDVPSHVRNGSPVSRIGAISEEPAVHQSPKD